MQKRKLGKSGLETAPLVLGGNVFGWTADEPTSFAILDAFGSRSRMSLAPESRLCDHSMHQSEQKMSGLPLRSTGLPAL